MFSMINSNVYQLKYCVAYSSIWLQHINTETFISLVRKTKQINLTISLNYVPEIPRQTLNLLVPLSLNETQE